MALNLEQQHAMAVDPAFVDRVEQAAIAAAIAVSSEDPATPGNTERAALAYRVLHDSREHARKFAKGLVTEDVGNALNDNEVRDTIAAVWNGYAGFNPTA